MTSAPEGWYPDPSTPGSGTQRWWDGTTWTEHTAPGQPQDPRPSFQAGRAPTTRATHLPDGTRLAGWGARVGASLIDFVILLPLTVLLSVPFWGRIGTAFGDYLEDVRRATEQGGPQPDQFALQRELGSTLVTIGLLGLALGLAWTFSWLRWRQATPGKLLLGLRIRRRDAPGPLSWSTIGRRWLVQSGPGLLGLIPIVGGLASLFTIIDSLWPLWDSRRQALHDKWAGTSVVVRERLDDQQSQIRQPGGGRTL